MSAIIDLINDLSNERQKLWLTKPTKATQEKRAERLEALDRQIKALWHDRRCELAGAIPVQREISGFDYTDLGNRAPSGSKWIIDKSITPLPYDEPKEVEIVPLADILKRRNKTLSWGSRNQLQTGVEVELIATP